MDSQLVIAVVTVTLTLTAVVGRVVWGVGRELRELRDAVAALKTLLERQRADERDWVLQQISRHAHECPVRETTDVRIQRPLA